jgi:hypothetical protein
MLIRDNAQPPNHSAGSSSSGAASPATDVKAAFASRLRDAMERKGWSISETARQASQLLKDGGRLPRAHVWHYAQGKALPRTRYL